MRALFPQGTPVPIRCWDGSVVDGERGPAPAVLHLRSPDALRRIVWSPGELGLGRAYVAGDLDVEGDMFAVLGLREALGSAGRGARLALGPRGWARAVAAAVRAGALGPPLAPPEAEARLRGRRHTPGRDAAAIAHHYDASNDFYRLLLGPSMTYSCAFFADPGTDLERAQEAKHELVCAKLGLQPGQRLLDVGCGWGSLAIHAARRHGVQVVAVTLSADQAELARRRVEEADLADRVAIRRQDYRDVDDGPFDAIASVGMFEHVGLARLGLYFEHLRDLLAPSGRLLNHAISRPSGQVRPQPRSFGERYVFPDGELQEVGRVVSAMQDRGLEVRDVESLREHYALTLRAWTANLEAHWERAAAVAGPARPRIWRLYLAASALNFEAGRTSVHQVLAVRPEGGRSGMPLTRRSWLGAGTGAVDPEPSAVAGA